MDHTDGYHHGQILFSEVDPFDWQYIGNQNALLRQLIRLISTPQGVGLTHDGVLVDDVVSLDAVELLLSVVTSSIVESEDNSVFVVEGNYSGSCDNWSSMISLE